MASLELIYRSAQTNYGGLVDCVFPFTYYEQTGEVVKERSLAEIRSSLEQADRVYFLMNAATIGDSVIATAYLSAVGEGFRTMGINPPKTILTTHFLGRIFDNLLHPGDTQVKTTAYRGLRFIRDEHEKEAMREKRSVVLDFQGMDWETPAPLLPVKIYGKRVTFAYRLYPTMITLYTNTTHGSGRFARPIEDLFSLPEGSIDPEKAQPKLVLPENAGDIYQQATSKNSLNPNDEQISIISEASNPDKRYPSVSWREVAGAILKSRPDIHINIIYNPSHTADSYLRDIFLEGNLRNVHLVSGSLEELMVFLARQKLVLSNDTGLAHIAAAVVGGPRVLTLFQSKEFTPDVWVSSKRQLPIFVAQTPPDLIAQQSLKLI